MSLAIESEALSSEIPWIAPEYIDGGRPYSLRPARPEDLEQLWGLYVNVAASIQEKPDTNGMWWPPYPTEEGKRAAMYADIVAGNTTIVEDCHGPAATVTLKDEGHPMLWNEEERKQPSLYLSRLMKRPDIQDELGKELIWWAVGRARDQDKIFLRLDVHDDVPRLLDYYEDDCEFYRLPSKIWAEYPSSARFQLNVKNVYGGMQRTSSIRGFTAEQLLESTPDYLAETTNLTPHLLAEWQSGRDLSYLSPQDLPVLLGSMTSGRLQLPTKRELLYEEDNRAVGLPSGSDVFLARNSPNEILIGETPALERWVHRYTVAHSRQLLDIPVGPIVIHDALTVQQQQRLTGRLGLSRFLTYLTLYEEPIALSIDESRGRQYVVTGDGETFSWQPHFAAIEKPATTQSAFHAAWNFYKGSKYTGEGVLAAGTFTAGELALDGMRLVLAGPGTESSGDPTESIDVVVDNYYRAPTGREFGLQSCDPKEGEPYMARISAPPAEPGTVSRRHATLVKIDNP